MYQVQGVIRDYDPSSDTATVELTSIGAIEAWLSGVTIAAGIPRAQISDGFLATIALPDAHRLCEATILVVYPGNAQAVSAAAFSGASRTENGRASIALDANGAGSATLSFPTPFSAVPGMVVTCDNNLLPSISSLSATQFTVTISGGTPHILTYFSWNASGPT